MHRRTLLALPLLPLPLPALATTHDISELRYGGTTTDTAARARALQRHLGIPVRAIRLDPAALAQAMNAGHIEFAALDTAGPTTALMGDRLIATPHGTIRRALPPTLRTDLAAALASI